MKVLVTIKRTVDPYVKIKVNSEHNQVDVEQAKKVINPFDEVALEAAVQLKEQGIATEIITVCLGLSESQDVLRKSLALGADRAILVETNNQLESLDIAKAIENIVKQEMPDLVIMGKQSIDNDAGEIGQMLAGLLHWPQATFASKIDIQDQTATVVCEMDGGQQIVSLTLPGLITVDLSLNTPRYAKLPDIMKSKQKPLTLIPFDELCVRRQSTQKWVRVEPPQPRQAGVTVDSVKVLLDKLRNEKRVL